MNKEEKRISRYISLQTIYAYEISSDEDILIYKQFIHHFQDDFNEYYGSLSNSQINFAEKLYISSIKNKNYVDSVLKVDGYFFGTCLIFTETICCIVWVGLI